MKNKLKSVRRGSKTATVSQATKRLAKRLSDELLNAIEHDNALRRRAGIVTCVWTGPDRQEVARVDFPREVFSRIKAVCINRGITLQQFSDVAINSYIELRKKCPAAHGS
jgi:adenosylmethionine-8-amino-7-oxononanoate aminotransferase